MIISTISSTAKVQRKVAPVSKQTRLSKKNVKKAYKSRVRKTKRTMLRHAFVFANVVLIIFVTAIVWTGNNKATTQKQAIVNPITTSSAQTSSAAIDEISSADIAVNIARSANLAETDSVTNQADSYGAQLSGVTKEETVITKPQLVNGGAKSRNDITNYVVKNGDTVSSIAQKFGVTSDSIRWSNGLSGETVAAGVSIVIPPRNGIVHRVSAGDTVDSIVQKYHANKELFIAMNDTDVSGLPVGQLVIVPDGVVQAVGRGYSSSYESYSGFSFGSSAVYGGNGYTYGYCTWHAANRRIAIGRPIPKNLGNAITWLRAAQAAGIPTGSTPRAGAVLWHGDIGGLGHVAFVEKVNADGSILVSDMNYPIWGRVTYRTVAPGDMGRYRFIY